MTPGQYRAHARYLRSMADEKRRLAASPDAVAHWRKYWLDDADRLDTDADDYDRMAGYGETTVEYSRIEPRQEAAE